MAEAPLLWVEMRRQDFLDVVDRSPVVVIPIGSIEQHGPHCPVDVDVSIPAHIALEAARRADDFPLVVGPTIPFGFTHYNQGFPGTISLRLETFLQLVAEVALSVRRNGFERVILLNGHGGNHHPLQAVAVRIAEEGLLPLAFSHWDLVGDDLLSWSERDADIGHAGEWETSIQLHLRPHLVDRERAVADDWQPSVDSRFATFARFPERRRETASGVMGDPTVASADKGRRYVELAVRRLVELARAFHHQPVRDYWQVEAR